MIKIFFVAEKVAGGCIKKNTSIKNKGSSALSSCFVVEAPGEQPASKGFFLSFSG
jgi:hypothetical protein